MKKVLKVVLGLLVAVIAVGAITIFAANKPLPEGKTGPGAQAMATKFEQAINMAAWQKTGAIQWDFGGRHQLLWDRHRNYVQVKWSGHEAIVRLKDKSGVAKKDGQTLQGAAAQAVLQKGFEWWANDSFWLNPLAKLRDDGVTLSEVELEDGGKGLLVSYASGGVTPGDSYLWIPGRDGLPSHWRMWVKIVPVGGLEVSWEGWKTLSTGAKVSTLHKSVITLELKDIKAAADLKTLLAGKEDPFAVLEAPAQPSSQPANTQTATTAN